MKEANVISRKEEAYIRSHRAEREAEITAFMQSDFKICELERFNKYVSNDYNAYVDVAYRMHLMGNKIEKNAIRIYTRNGKIYAAKDME